MNKLSLEEVVEEASNIHGRLTRVRGDRPLTDGEHDVYTLAKLVARLGILLGQLTAIDEECAELRKVRNRQVLRSTR